MRSVDDFVAFARRQWRRRYPDWLAGGADGDLDWTLHPPTQAEALARPDEVAAWVTSWQRFGARPGATVEWVSRRWPSMGTQRLPTRVRASAELVAGLAGETAGWAIARQAVDGLTRGWPDLDLAAGIAVAARGLLALEAEDVPRLHAVLGWISAHPDSGIWERELPVVGIDTKWVERHRAAIEPLAASITGTGTGLRRRGIGFLVRDLAAAADDTGLSVDLAGLARLGFVPAVVLVVENLTTVATLPPLPGTVAIHGMGFAAPTLAEVDWVRSADVVYWGDLDTYGFQILGRVRAALPQTRSVLMDVETLRAAGDFAVTEPRPYRGEIGHLTLDELSALAALRAGDLRLEQERIPRELAHAALAAAVAPHG